MENTYKKLSDTELKVTKPAEEIKTVANTYSIDFLKSQEVAILKSKNDFVEARDKELAEVRELLQKCEELDIKSTVAVKLEEETLREEELTKEVISDIIK
jgi:hypothetical protein